MSDNLSTLLNKVEAIIDCRAGTTRELASFLSRRPQRVSEWIGQRKHEPPGSIAIEMQNWASSKTLAIALAPRLLQSKYRASYHAIVERRGR